MLPIRLTITVMLRSRLFPLKAAGEKRPVWALFYGHYVQLMHFSALEIKAAIMNEGNEGNEGCGGNHGPNSGGYDQLGYGTLTLLN